MNELLNHLWQSTAFAVVVGAAAVLLRRNSPRLRYWLWLAASAKFLIPFSLLVATGATVHLPADSPTLRATTVQQISGYFSPASIIPVAATHAAFPWTRVLIGIWAAGAILLLFRWFRRWRTIHIATRRAVKIDLPCSVPSFSSPAMMEPGVFGILRPVLLLPEGLADTLTPEQFAAILAHESRHLKYRDNLTAAFHMLVEILFWFHPLVWWIGAKLMEERERDCDEAVLTQGNQPSDYARGIVTVCQTYVESPLPCASGISGADLKTRIREIMTWRGSLPVTLSGKAMLAGAALAVLAIPFAIGIVRAQTLPPPPAYNYAVVSIHKTDPAERNIRITEGPQGGLRTLNTSVVKLLSGAYRIEDYQIAGAPAWASTERFDVTFTPDKEEITPDSNAGLKSWESFFDRNRQRLQAVLRDRFSLVVRIENRKLPIYILTQGKNGHKLSPHPADKPNPSISTNGDRQIRATDATMEMLAAQLSMQLRRPVRDETHLSGQFDFTVNWIPDPDLPTAPVFGAIADQLGLRLDAAKGPVPVYIIEKVEHPTEN